MIKDYTDHELTRRIRYYNYIKLLNYLVIGSSLLIVVTLIYVLVTII